MEGNGYGNRLRRRLGSFGGGWHCSPCMGGGSNHGCVVVVAGGPTSQPLEHKPLHIRGVGFGSWRGAGALATRVVPTRVGVCPLAAPPAIGCWAGKRKDLGRRHLRARARECDAGREVGGARVTAVLAHPGRLTDCQVLPARRQGPVEGRGPMSRRAARPRHSSRGGPPQRSSLASTVVTSWRRPGAIVRVRVGPRFRGRARVGVRVGV